MFCFPYSTEPSAGWVSVTAFISVRAHTAVGHFLERGLLMPVLPPSDSQQRASFCIFSYNLICLFCCVHLLCIVLFVVSLLLCSRRCVNLEFSHPSAFPSMQGNTEQWRDGKGKLQTFGFPPHPFSPGLCVLPITDVWSSDMALWLVLILEHSLLCVWAVL